MPFFFSRTVPGRVTCCSPELELEPPERELLERELLLLLLCHSSPLNEVLLQRRGGTQCTYSGPELAMVMNAGSAAPCMLYVTLLRAAVKHTWLAHQHWT